MLDRKQTFHPYGAWLCLYYIVATTISPLRGYDQSGLTVGSDAARGNEKGLAVMLTHYQIKPVTPQ
jgi:hypothetical protein